MNIQSLLNSPVGGSVHRGNGGSRCSPPAAPPYQPDVAGQKRSKLAKDAPIFAEGTKIVGHVNYPPHEAGGDRDLDARHLEFGVYPLGQIYSKGVRHIPYASDKKDFLEKTARESFEVFQYNYKRPGDEKSYTVVWDYNIGLVRMTPFFKSCKYSKTVPAKALNQNPGLKDISYSITGGALICQGYWVPWQAARELAATFCWDIRWALTPVFGNDFPQMCKPPHDHTFAKFVINPSTVRFCQTETDRFRTERASYQLLPPKVSSPIAKSLMPTFTPPAWERGGLASPESGYGTDIDRYKCGSSGRISPHSLYSVAPLASVIEVRSPTSSSTTLPSTLNSPVAAFALTPLSASSPAPESPYSESLRTKRTHSKVVYDGCDDAVVMVDVLPNERQGCIDAEPRLPSIRTVEAAEILMSIGVVARYVAAAPEPKRTRRGSRY